MRNLHPPLKSSAQALHKVLSSHCHAIKLNLILDTYAANNILSGYTKCKDLRAAHKLFVEMPQRDTVTWNTMIAGYVNSGSLESAWDVLKDMRRFGFAVDGYTFGSLLKGVACYYRLDLGQQVHSVIVKTGYAGNVYSGSALLDMYAKCSKVDDAFIVFQHMPEHNLVSWNALLAGFVQVDDRDAAVWVLDCIRREGLSPDDGTFAPLLTLLHDGEFYTLVMQIHGLVIKQGLESHNTVCNATITSY